MPGKIAIDEADVRLAVGYLRNLARSFAAIPKGLDPTFYHTLSYEGDVAEGERLRALIARLALEHFALSIDCTVTNKEQLAWLTEALGRFAELLPARAEQQNDGPDKAVRDEG